MIYKQIPEKYLVKMGLKDYLTKYYAFVNVLKCINTCLLEKEDYCTSNDGDAVRWGKMVNNFTTLIEMSKREISNILEIKEVDTDAGQDIDVLNKYFDTYNKYFDTYFNMFSETELNFGVISYEKNKLSTEIYDVIEKDYPNKVIPVIAGKLDGTLAHI